ncbi:hypothetical protein SNARM312S_04737 [Streptomyces narbonensis]
MAWTGTQTPAVNMVGKKTAEPTAVAIFCVRETAHTAAPSASPPATARSRARA